MDVPPLLVRLVIDRRPPYDVLIRAHPNARSVARAVRVYVEGVRELPVDHVETVYAGGWVVRVTTRR